MKELAIKMIRFYQRKISPLFPPRCRYYPTCSQYAVTAIERFGIIRGGFTRSMASFKVQSSVSGRT